MAFSYFGRRYAPRRRFWSPYRRRSYSRATYVPRRTRRRAPVRRRRARASFPRPDALVPKVLGPGEKFALLQIDPFESRGLGGKIPDSTTVPSLSVTTTEIVNLDLAVGTNSRCWGFTPAVSATIVSATEGAGSWTWAAAYGGTGSSSKRTDYIAAYELDRPVAHGVRISSGVAPTSATGFVHVAIAYEGYYNQATWPFPTTTAGMAAYAWYKRVPLASLTQTPMTIINKYVDETAFRYRDSTAAAYTNAGIAEFHTAGGWGTILIAVEGGAAGQLNPIQAEWVYHSEAIPKNTGVASGTPAAPMNSTILSGTSQMVANTDLTHTEVNQSSYQEAALAVFSAAVGEAGDVVFQNVALPIVQNLGRYAVYGAANMAANALGIGGVNNNIERNSLTRRNYM